MKIGLFNFPPKSIKEKKEEIIEYNGNPELAKNKEIYGILSDPEFIKAFPGPADFQYSLIRESLISSKENAINGIAYLKEYIKTSDNPLFCLVRLSGFLHTAIGNQKSLANTKEQKEISEILEKGFKDMSSDDETKYFLGVTLSPDIILAKTQSFEGQEGGLTPVHLSAGYFVQDNGFDPIPIFYHTYDPLGFNSIIEEQKKFFENARPENRPEMSKNPTLKEMMEYKRKYLNSTIYFSEIKKDIRQKINNLTYRLEPEEIQKFFPASQNTFELIQDPLMFEFRAFINPVIRSKIEKEFGISLVGVPLKEQIFFLTSITNRTNKNIKPVQDFTKTFKEAGLRTFLSVEQGGSGDKILALGDPKNLSKKSAEILFAKYGEYIDAVNSVEEVVNKEYKLTPSQELVNKTKESLLIRGRDLLLDQHQKLLDGEFREDKFIQSIDNTKVGVDLFKNIFRIVKENNPDTSFEDFAGIVPEHIPPSDQMEDKDILTIDKIIDKNYPNEELRNAVKESFHKALKSGKTAFDLLKRNKDIIALDRIDQKEDGSLYFGSFNVDPDYCSSKIGAAFFEATVLPLMKEKIVRADCSSLQPIASYYIESGFIATRLYEYNGEPSFSLESIPEKRYKSKDLTKLQIIEQSQKDKNQEGLIIKSASSQKEMTDHKIPEDYVLTRYFFDKESKQWFIVLEKTS